MTGRFLYANRDAAIDAARGIALVIMMAANMGPVLAEPHSWFMRVSGSLAAPIFILLSGMMVARNPNLRWKVVVQRALMLLLWGVFVDMAAWGIRPFFGVDVLYLIAIGTVVTYALRRASDTVLLAAIALLVFGASLLQHLFGYTFYPTERELLSGIIIVAVEGQTKLWQHYLIDGWFPIFPWLAYMLAGVMLARRRWTASGTVFFTDKKWLQASAAVTAAGCALWWLHPGAMLDRQGFSELFYPPTIGFVVASMGAVVGLLALIDHRRGHPLWNPLRFLGQHSLLIYIAHSLVIGRVFFAWWGETPLEAVDFLLAWAGFVLSMLALAGLMQLIQRRG